MYHLHAILCHRGSLNRGHYFSFVRVGIAKNGRFDDGTWVKFNDQTVVPSFKHVAIGTGQGGYNTTYRCELNNGEEDTDDQPEARSKTAPSGKTKAAALDLQDLLSDVEEPAATTAKELQTLSETSDIVETRRACNT